MLIALVAVFATTLEIIGIISAIHALLYARTPQATIAWVISLVTFPLLTLPFYWIFGRSKFQGYVEAIRDALEKSGETIPKVLKEMKTFRVPPTLAGEAPFARSVFEGLADVPFTRGNHAQLLLNGQKTFEAIFEAISSAQEYILLQFFIVRDDGLGNRLRAILEERAQKGVKIYFLYDEIGSRKLDEEYIEKLEKKGGVMRPFGSTQGFFNRFQLNFRNHRKTVIVDGKTAFVGGHNIGDEYLGISKKFGFWRDTHLRVEGPALQGIQLAFAADWHWATGELLSLRWKPAASDKGNLTILPLPTDPSHRFDSCSLLFVNTILTARERFWMATPYFIPNQAVLQALQVAALRGVDVRILLPDNPDKWIPWLASHAFLQQLAGTGVSVYRYTRGFMHQKVMLVDETLACIGTANADNRSFQLNFETTVLVNDASFCRQVSQMLEEDMASCRTIQPGALPGPRFLMRVLVRVARLFSPIL